MLKFFNELKRRKVLTTLGVYAGAAFIIVQVAEITFHRLLIPDWTVTFVIVLAILGFPITFFLSWTYDLKRDADAGDKRGYEDGPQVKKTKKILLPITGLLTIIGGAFWIWYSLVGVTSATDIDFRAGIKKSIAILHFENLTGNKEGDYFCSALTEQIRGSLAKLGKLDIASRLISNKLKNKSGNQTIYEGLDYYVEGTLSRASNNNNINISLINAQNHKVRWAQQYTFVENDIVQYKDTILNNIAINLDIDYQPIQLMSNKEKDISLNEDQENIGSNDINLSNNEKKETGSEPQDGDIKFLMSELNEQLQTVTDKWKRALADYQNLEKQTIDRINAREDKIILHFLTVYEDFIRAKNAYEKDGTNVEGLDVIIKNMGSILDNYEVKAIEAEGKKLDPKLHEVVQEIGEDGLEEGTIVKEIAKGYIIRGEVLKYSKVCVSKKLIKK